jgi:multiple sugar transport system substrate-binding protein
MEKNKIILFSVIGLVIVVVLVVIYMNPFREATPVQVTLEFWSVFDDSEVYKPIIDAFQKQYPNVAINYYKKSIDTYEKELVDALAAGRGPDIFSIHNTWLPKHVDKLMPAPDTMITPSRYSEVFVEAAVQDFVSDGKVYAFPMSVDTLALFYNKDLFNGAAIAQPPVYWTDFNTAVEKLTQRDAKNNILQSGAALGTARNINRSTDILTMFMMQSGAKMLSDDKSFAAFDQPVSLSSGESFNPGQQALLYYTSFANPTKKVYSWNQYQHYSVDAFVEGKAAMMISYAYQIPLIRARAPHLNFAVALLPQISSKAKKITFANYWAQAVSKSSKNQNTAWQFLAWLSSADSQKMYAQNAKKPVARRDLVDWQKSDADLGVFAQQTLMAQSWWEIDSAAIERILADAIESVTGSSVSVSDALTQANQQVSLLLQSRQ